MDGDRVSLMPALDLQIRVKESLVPDLCAWWKERREKNKAYSLARFLSEFLECEILEYRAARMADRRHARLLQQAPAPEITLPRGRPRLSPEGVQKLLFLAHEMGRRELAKRFHVGESTVRRILAAHGETEHVRVPGVRTAGVCEEERERRKKFQLQSVHSAAD